MNQLKASGSFVIDPHEQIGRSALRLVESAIECYADAREARVDDDSAGAELLRAAGDKSMRVAVHIAEELAEL